MKEYKYKIKGVSYDVQVLGVEDNIAKVEVNGIPFDVEMENPIPQPKPVVRAVAAPVKTVEAPKAAVEAAQVAAGVTAVTAPLPGTIVEIKVNVGDTVEVGQTLIVLEAMKMENNIDCERTGKIQSIKVAKGDSVMEGSLLLTIE